MNDAFTNRDIASFASAGRRPYRIAGIGEILWDLFPDESRFGGAPANYACHAAAVNGSSMLVSAVGCDDLGQRAIEVLSEKQVDTQFVQVLAGKLTTGAVRVSIDKDGIASYAFGQEEAWDHLAWSRELESLAPTLDAVCFGTLGQRNSVSRGTMQSLLSKTRRNCLRIFDVNLRPPYWSPKQISESLGLANVVKLNEVELPVVADLFGLGGSEISQLEKLSQRFQLNVVAYTRGADGAVLWQNKRVDECDGFPASVCDTVGAGDAFSAIMTIGLLRGEELATINRWACRVAAFVCSQAGATPTLPPELCTL